MIIKILIGIVIYFILLIGICIFLKGQQKLKKNTKKEKKERRYWRKYKKINKKA